MPTILAPTPAPDAAHRPRTGWLAAGSVTVAIFVIVTTEILPIGLLTSIGADFTVTDGMAGLTMTLPGLVAAVAAPIVTLATARIDRRRMLCQFMFLLVLADVLMALATDYRLVLLSRVLVGVTIGGFWSIAAGLAERLVGARAAARANTVIFASVPLGSVFGVPAGTYLGAVAGWRTAFLVVGALGAVVLGMLLVFLPALPARQVTRPAVLRDLLHRADTRFALGVTFLVVLGHFGAYTYLTPFLEQVTRAGAGTVTALLLGYGVAGIAGNVLGGMFAPRAPRATIAAAAGLLATAAAALPIAGTSAGGALVLLIVWGIGYGAVPVTSQTWFARAAAQTPEAASVLFTASFQATLSLGALAGAMVVDHSSPSTVLILGGAVAALVIPTAVAHFARSRDRG